MSCGRTFTQLTNKRNENSIHSPTFILHVYFIKYKYPKRSNSRTMVDAGTAQPHCWRVLRCLFLVQTAPTEPNRVKDGFFFVDCSPTHWQPPTPPPLQHPQHRMNGKMNAFLSSGYYLCLSTETEASVWIYRMCECYATSLSVRFFVRKFFSLHPLFVVYIS